MIKVPARPDTRGDTPMMIPRERIAMRAYERWCQRGYVHGHDMQDWLEAEAELRMECQQTPELMPRR